MVVGTFPASAFAQDPILLRELAAETTPWWQRAISFVGIIALIGLAWLMSSKRRSFPWRIVIWGIGLQLLFALLILKTKAGQLLFGFLNDVVIRLLQFTDVGSEFLFGEYLSLKFSIALKVLPTILFFSSLMAILYHLGIMQMLVRKIAWVMRRTMKTSGSETLSAAANIFVGQTEAPLVIKPYLNTMTRSELNAVMVGGFATIAGGVLAGYVEMLRTRFPDIAGHLIAASVMSAPAALLIAKVMVPETEESPTLGEVELDVERVDVNVLDAAVRGTTEGLRLALNVGAMLLVFLALVALINALIGLPVDIWNSAFETNYHPWSLEQIFGALFWPISLMMGVPIEDCSTVGTLLGEKIVLNEFVAYGHLSDLLSADHSLSPRSVVIATYALCGFANFGSIGIQIGGISALAEKRRGELAKLGFRAMLGGSLAAFMTATVAGMVL